MLSIFRRKSVDDLLRESGGETGRLRRVLGPVDVTMIGIGAIIGAGIFAMVGEAAVGASSGYPGGTGASYFVYFDSDRMRIQRSLLR